MKLNLNQRDPVRMYFGHRYVIETRSDDWPDFHIDGSDNHIILRTQWGTSFFGGIILKLDGVTCS